MTYSFKRDEIIILLGAGASVDAGIPNSKTMIDRIEENLSKDDKWKKFNKLYNYIRSAIYYLHGLEGVFDGGVNYNIEKLVDTLNEISKRNQHILYPFVGAWNPMLVEVAGEEFNLVKEFSDKILEILRREWLAVKNYKKDADYYSKILQFWKEYEYSLRIFSLNYDLCLEKICESNDVNLVRGFDDNSIWDWRQFDDNTNEEKDIYLYKLHGSIDWAYEHSDLTYCDDSSSISINQSALIFGTSYKMEYRDPFLFLTYEFRKWTLESKIIVVIGYGFGDEHINKIIQQALTKNKKRVLLSVSPDINLTHDKIRLLIDYNEISQIKIENKTAKDFMTSCLSLEYLANLIDDEEELFPTL